MNGRLTKAAACLALGVAIAGCDADPAGTNGGGAHLSVLLTDAPGDFVSAEVEILQIYLQGTTDGGDRHVLFAGSNLLDLLELTNGVTAELAEVTIPAGTYHQLRLVTGDITVETESGQTFSTEDGTLHCPSCGQSGLKVKLPGGGLMLDNGDHSMIIDFDVAQSFGKERGRSGRWVMHPVINASLAEASGRIAGKAALADGVTFPTCGGAATDLTKFKPTAKLGEVTLTAATEADGDFVFPYVSAGEYEMGFLATVDFENAERLTLAATAAPEDANVEAGKTATVNYTISSATCAPIPPAP